MAPLLTYAQAKQNLRLPDDREQAAVEEKIAEATAIVLTFIGRPENDWTADTDPAADPDFAIVQAGLYYQLGKLWRRGRGDEAEIKPEDPAQGAYLDANLRRILHPLRRPSLA